MGGGGKKGKKVTVGYRYYVGLQMVFCHAVDWVSNIYVGEKRAYKGRVKSKQITGSTWINIDAPGLFGGDSREGGVSGLVDVCFGEPVQAPNDYLQNKIGTNIPAFRGVLSLVVRGALVAAMNPYIKPWSMDATRVTTGWHDELSGLIHNPFTPWLNVDMNPAHIIREALTDTTWGGLGYPVSDIDDAAFLAAAETLYAEKLGLSLVWGRNTSVGDFITLILKHIDGVLFYNHTSGLLTLRLIRGDYVAGSLSVLDTSNIIDMVDYTMTVVSEAVNQVTVNYVDRENNPRSVTVQDIAGINRMAGAINPVTIDYVGVAEGELAARLATRDLTQVCLPMSTITLEINRKYAHLEPGDCFTFNWEPLGIAGAVMRVTEIEIGPLTAGSVRVKAVSDVFGRSAASFATPTGSQWVSPENAPANAVYRRVEEMTWWQFVREFGESSAVLNELTDTSTMIISYCGRPSSDALDYEMWARNAGGSEWIYITNDSFPFITTLPAGVPAEIESVLMLSGINADTVQVGMYAALGAELVGVTAVNTETGAVTVDRGVLDTVPIPHAIGTTIWFHQNFFALDSENRSVGETIDVKLLPSTTLGRLLIDDATINTYTTVGRMMRPYPPGNVRVNSLYWPSSIGLVDELTVTWSHRDRTAQTVTLNRQDEGNIGPESGVTYTLRIYGETDTLLRTETGLTTTAYTYLTLDEETDSAFDPARLNTRLRFELESQRSTLTSYKKWNIEVIRA